jgi:hypothetical protein
MQTDAAAHSVHLRRALRRAHQAQNIPSPVAETSFAFARSAKMLLHAIPEEKTLAA